MSAPRSNVPGPPNPQNGFIRRVFECPPPSLKRPHHLRDIARRILDARRHHRLYRRPVHRRRQWHAHRLPFPGLIPAAKLVPAGCPPIATLKVMLSAPEARPDSRSLAPTVIAETGPLPASLTRGGIHSVGRRSSSRSIQRAGVIISSQVSGPACIASYV